MAVSSDPVRDISVMMYGQFAGPPPAPVPPDCHGTRGYPSPTDRREWTSEGRSRIQEGPRQGNGPGVSCDEGYTCEGVSGHGRYNQGPGKCRNVEREKRLMREVDELRVRTSQMEKTLRYWIYIYGKLIFNEHISDGGVTVWPTGEINGQR